MKRAQHPSQLALRNTWRRQGPGIALTFSMILAVAIYWSGLSGPLLVDDMPTLAIVGSWLAGKASLEQVLFGNLSWLTDRAVAMASFAFNAWIGGPTSYSLKIGNLLLHLICGVLAYNVIALALRRDPALAVHARWIAAGIVTIWLIHPLNVSTVLYVVQRMAQIAALCCLAGVYLYMRIRTAMLAGRMSNTRGVTAIGAAVLVLVAVGIQGKQTAVILPALCLVVELAWFQQPRQWPRALSLFYIATCLLPSIAIAVGVAWKYQAISTAHLDYGFSLAQRLLSAPRVLVEYVRMILFPYTPSMGLFADDFQPSLDATHPAMTLPALLLLLAVSVGAWCLRRRQPAIFAGWFLFLVGHSVEASILPIELYYEHRNYLPALGLLTAATAVLLSVGAWLSSNGIRSGRIGAVMSAGILAVLSFQTIGRVNIWQHGYTIGLAAVDARPDSLRATMIFAESAIAIGRTEEAYAAFDRLKTSNDPRTRATAAILGIALDCKTKHDADPALLSSAAAQFPELILYSTPHLFSYASSIIRNGKCGRISPKLLADAASHVADGHQSQPEAAIPVVGMRYLAAENYLRSGELELSLSQIERAWAVTDNPAVLEIYVSALLKKGRHADAERVYREAVTRVGSRDADGLKGLRKMLDNHSAHGRQAPRPATQPTDHANRETTTEASPKPASPGR